MITLGLFLGTTLVFHSPTCKNVFSGGKTALKSNWIESRHVFCRAWNTSHAVPRGHACWSAGHWLHRAVLPESLPCRVLWTRWSQSYVPQSSGHKASQTHYINLKVSRQGSGQVLCYPYATIYHLDSSHYHTDNVSSSQAMGLCPCHSQSANTKMWKWQRNSLFACG